MYTREDYLDNKCTHREYYAQFVNSYIIKAVRQSIGEGRIAASTDSAFNDIPLRFWDNLAPVTYSESKSLKEAGDFVTLGGAVCILKEAARQILDGLSTTSLTKEGARK